MIKPDYLNKWTYHPEFATADTSNINDSVDAVADAIDRIVHYIYNEKEANMVEVKFNDLEKELKEFGIELSTIRSSSGNSTYEMEGYLTPSSTIRSSFGNSTYEIEGYFTPSVYKARNAREKLTYVHPVRRKPVPKKVIFSGPATTILWKDGTKTTVKCSSEDVWEDEVGIAMCYLKKMLGNKGNYNNIFREAMKVAEVQTKKEELTSSTAIEGESYYSSALDSMKRNIDEINDFMKDAADALDKALGGKK